MKIVEPRKCVECGGPIPYLTSPAVYKKALYCGRVCAARARQKRQQEANHVKPKTHP